MQHPDERFQKNQEEFLKRCPEKDREFHASIFRIGNAAYIYHHLAYNTNEKILKSYFQEWLEGLPPHIGDDMKRLGFEECRTHLPFTRYVNERNDIGMKEWMKENLSEEDYNFYSSHKSN
jgi:hypothetical protein